MKFMKRFDLEGKHALLSPSRHSWLNYENKEDIIRMMAGARMAEIGTILHSLAAERIEYGFKYKKDDKRNVMFELIKRKIPSAIINYLDFDMIFENLMNYVNDAIGYQMQPEVSLYYSDYAFGHADALSFKERTNFLRIHDLKTGVTPASMDQLLSYAALFFLDAQTKLIKLADCKIELRIYQNNEIIVHNPGPDEILPIIDDYKAKDEWCKEVLS